MHHEHGSITHAFARMHTLIQPRRQQAIDQHSCASIPCRTSRLGGDDLLEVSKCHLNPGTCLQARSHTNVWQRLGSRPRKLHLALLPDSLDCCMPQLNHSASTSQRSRIRCAVCNQQTLLEQPADPASASSRPCLVAAPGCREEAALRHSQTVAFRRSQDKVDPPAYGQSKAELYWTRQCR